MLKYQSNERSSLDWFIYDIKEDIKNSKPEVVEEEKQEDAVYRVVEPVLNDDFSFKPKES